MGQRLYRSTQDRKLLGVCGGLGHYFGIDPTFVRIGVVLLTIFLGAPALFYFVFAFIMPKEPVWTVGFEERSHSMVDLDDEINHLEKRALQQEVHRLRAELAKYKSQTQF